MENPFQGIEPKSKRPAVEVPPQTMSLLERLMFWIVILLAVLNMQVFYFIASNVYDRAELAGQKAALEKKLKQIQP